MPKKLLLLVLKIIIYSERSEAPQTREVYNLVVREARVPRGVSNLQSRPVHLYLYTAISRKIVGKNVHATIPKDNMGFDQHSIPDTLAVEPTFVTFL